MQTHHFFPGYNSKTPKLKSSKTQTLATVPGKAQGTFFSGSNLWLLKPTHFNQGQGINLFNNLIHLDYHIKALQKGVSSPLRSVQTPQIGRRKQFGTIVKSNQFVIQKYIEKPMLIENRKFDIRVWVLVDQDMNLYCFKEKYIRLSSEAFSLDEGKVTDKYIHLTNHAVQRHGKNYSKHESGNILSFSDLKVKVTFLN